MSQVLGLDVHPSGQRNLGALRWLVLQCTAACRGAAGWRPCGVAEGVPMSGMTWMWDSLTSKNYSRHAMQILKWPRIAMEIGPSSPSKIGSKVLHGDVQRDSHLTLVCFPKVSKMDQSGKGRVSDYFWCLLMLLILNLQVHYLFHARCGFKMPIALCLAPWRSATGAWPAGSKIVTCFVSQCVLYPMVGL